MWSFFYHRKATLFYGYLKCKDVPYEEDYFMKFSESLKKNSYFQNVYKNGKSYANRYFVMYVLENNLAVNRLGISVSKKVGNSVIRHHITRLIREAYRLHEETFNSGLDIVIIVRVSAKNVTYRETERAILRLGNLHQILKKEIECKNGTAQSCSD